jgi:hypothetical protein
VFGYRFYSGGRDRGKTRQDKTKQELEDISNVVLSIARQENE